MKLQWMRLRGPGPAPRITLFRTEVELDGSGRFGFEYTADEKCQWFADGELVAAGPELGTPEWWYKGKVKLRRTPGRHVLVARVLAFGADAAANQLSIRPGFACSLPGPWTCREMTGLAYEKAWPDWGSLPRVRVSAKYDPAWLQGCGDGWVTPEFYEDGRELHEPTLPELLQNEVTDYVYENGLVRFADYECVWPSWEFSGKGTVSIRWGETGYLTSNFNRHNLKGEKGRRDGSFRVGKFDVFEVNGSLSFTDLQWRAGRYAEIRCTGSAKVEKMVFRRHGYPYHFRFDLEAMPEPWRGALRMAARTLECCSHDSFMDCPFYERLMYIGDARIEALCAYAAADDDLLARKALRFFALSQKGSGATLSRYPAKVEQAIPSFAAIFILMLHDFMMHRSDLEFVREMLPAARKAADYLLSSKKEDGLLYPPGWNFIDWVWPQHGIPFGSDCGTNSILNLLIVLALKDLSGLEHFAGTPEQEKHYGTESENLFRKVSEIYYVPEKQLFADDKEHRFYSEHAQVLALLSHSLPQLWDGLRQADKLTSCGIYFSHYYLEACRKYGQEEMFNARLAQWCELENLGLKTLPEEFCFPRSDCHAWSSHILYHCCLMKRGKA